MIRDKVPFLVALLLLAGAAGAAPALAAERMVAVIMPGALPRHLAAHEAFGGILRTGGAGEGKVKVFVQKPNPDRMSITNSIRRAIQAGAEILVTYGAPATLAAQQEARKIPVLFADVYDPVSLGIVNSLAAPGADLTGASSTVPLATLVEKMRQIRPVDRMGVVFTAAEADSALQAAQMQALGSREGFSVLKREVSGQDQLVDAVAGLLDRVDVLYLAQGTAWAKGAADAAEKARSKKVPVISSIAGLGDGGALLTLEADPEEQGKLVAVHLLQVLAGQKAHMLPVRTPKKMVLVVNSGTARQLSLTLPDTLVSEAGRVID